MLLGREAELRRVDQLLTVKTIEFHLSNVYRKLGLRSRSELAVWLARRDRAVAAGNS